MIPLFVPLACIGLISKPSLNTAITKKMNREVVDLLSSSAASSDDSSSSSSSGLPAGIGIADQSIQEFTGTEVDHCDDNLSISSMDASFIRCEIVNKAAALQSQQLDEECSTAIEILSSDADSEVRSNNNDDDDGCCSSSASSGIPGQSPDKKTTVDDQSKSTAKISNDANGQSGSVSAAKKPIKSTTKRKKRRWGQKSQSIETTNNESNKPVTTTLSKQKKSTSTFFHCYLLRSLDPDHPLKTYIGFTTHPARRIRQHNGILKNGGARRTRRSGRPWTFCCIIGGFASKYDALSFEWHWQHVGKSKVFREAVGDDALARKMGRRRGVNARLEEMRVLLNGCKPWCEVGGFTVYFLEEKIHLQFCQLLSKANQNDDDGDNNSARKNDLKKRVCSVDQMPFAIDLESKKKRGKANKSTAAAPSSVGEDTSEVSSSHSISEENSKSSTLNEGSSHNVADESDFPEQRDVNVDSLDIHNLSIVMETQSWENLSLDSSVERIDIESNYCKGQENVCANNTVTSKPDVYDLCDSP